HIDHMQGTDSAGNILASEETAFLAEKRGYNLKLAGKMPEDLRLVDSGHILGSRGLLIGREIFYTGDFSVRPRAFMAGCEPVECDTLIVESTFGRRDYVFPPVAENLGKVNQLISGLFSRGIPIVLMGCSLGKAQILSYLFSSWDPIYVEESVLTMNRAHIERGVDIRSDLKSYSAAKEEGLLQKKPWILIAPMNSGRNRFVASLKKKYGAVTVAFSGWSVDPRFKYMMDVDHAFPLSDHCDFNDLVDMVRRCSPYKVYTVHGFAEEFASHLKSMGFDARPLKSGQMSISEYLFED
ncbi:MAG: MBL fold metallo-hydrolase RNA specificity domain-containing protein, partial [Nitrososphaerales archaeon]